MRVLVVDDDPAYRLLLEQAVRSFGHDAVVATDGIEAWECFLSARPDVVLTDWTMPGLDGIELCTRVREHPDGWMTYVILVTGRDAQDQVATGIRAGADDYLTKPLVVEDLHIRLLAARRVIALHRELARQRADLEALNQQLGVMARHDPLTGLGNRLALREDLEQVRARVDRYGHRYAVALFDVDHFKRYNDHYGHLAGDEVLVHVADVMRAVSRQGDAYYRYGGEEFLCVFPEPGGDEDGATVATERLRAGIEALALPHVGNDPGVVTISAGLAWLDDRPVDDVLKAADAALYRAKEAGRNRVEVAGQATSTATRSRSRPR
jgi:two-component system chemotaxis response regulator CheY